MQLLDSIPARWKRVINENITETTNIIPNLGLLQCTRIVPFETLTSKKIYTMLIRKRNHTPTSKIYYTETFDQPINWLKVYMLPRKITKNAYAQIFQYKILNNILYLNDKLFQFGLSETRECPFCNSHIEDLTHLFCNCEKTMNLWAELMETLSPFLSLDVLDTQSALLGFDVATNYLLKIIFY